MSLCLKAYDQHLNMVLGDVEEVITTVEIDEETYEEIFKVGHSQGKFTPYQCIFAKKHLLNKVVSLLSRAVPKFEDSADGSLSPFLVNFQLDVAYLV